MTQNTATDSVVPFGNDTAEDRGSGIVDSEMKANAQPPAPGDDADEVAIDSDNESDGGTAAEVSTDAQPGSAMPPVAERSTDEEAGRTSELDVERFEALDDGTIEVPDDEIEMAESVAPARSRPPLRPSARPAGSLPPPRRPSLRVDLGVSSLPPARAIDPWALANKTLELGRAQTKIAALEDQLAYRDATVADLEARLATARAQIVELEHRSAAHEQRRRLQAAQVQGGAQVPAPKGLTVPSVEGSSAKGPPGSSVATSPSGPSSADSVEAGASEVAGSAKPVASEVAGSAKPAASEGADADAASTKVRSAEAVSDAVASAAAVVTPVGTPVDEAPTKEAQGKAAQGKAAQGNEKAPSSQDPESLSRVQQIGTRCEAALRKHGVTRLSQIAAWSDEDIRRIAKAIKVPKSRIVKGGWVKAARAALK
jgi:predicted flap endonuclease-1-like 5' DNA nuclease